MNGLRFLSLFAGIGGFDLGLERAGFECAGQVEIDPFCQRVLAARWPGVERAADVRTLGLTSGGGWTVQPLDLLVGGFPCQGASVAGKRRGLADDRTALFWEIIRVQKIVQAPWALLENVPGLRSVGLGHDFPTVLAALAECWPAVGWRTLDSRFFNVAQRRERVFFVCGPTEAGVAEVLAITEGGAGDLEAGGEAGSAASAAVVASTLNSGGNDGGFRTEPGEHIVIGQCHGSNVGPMGTLRKGNGNVGSGVPFVAETLSGPLGGGDHGRGRRTEDDPNLIAFDTTQITSQLNRNNPKPGDPCHPLAAGMHAPAIAFTERTRADGRNVEQQEELASSLNNPGGGGRTQENRVMAASAVRRLTPVECERLQAFPDGWTCLCQPLETYAQDPDSAALACTCTDSARYRALGNAVTVSVVEWLGHRLMRAM